MLDVVLIVHLGPCREGMKVPANVVDQLVKGAQSDIRQVINMLSTWRLSSETMDFDEGKQLYVVFRLPFHRHTARHFGHG